MSWWPSSVSATPSTLELGTTSSVVWAVVSESVSLLPKQPLVARRSSVGTIVLEDWTVRTPLNSAKHSGIRLILPDPLRWLLSIKPLKVLTMYELLVFSKLPCSSTNQLQIFHKVLVLYEGRQIYFGRTTEAKEYFVNLGFDCPDRQTTADFLTSMTSSKERVVRQGFENRVPRTPDDFARAWQNSPERAELLNEVDNYNQKYALSGQHLEEFKDSRRAQQSKQQRVTSPFTLSYGGQIALCLRRGFWRLKGDPSLTLTQIIGNSIMGLIISSIFYNISSTSDSFFTRSALLFFAILMSAFSSALEVCPVSHFLFCQIFNDLSRFWHFTPNVPLSKSTTDMLSTTHLARLLLLCLQTCPTK